VGRGAGDGDTLAAWLAEQYAPAFRTASLILHNRADAEEAVQEAFLRAWRFRDAMPEGAAARSWIYRVVVNTCLSKLKRRRDIIGVHDIAAGDIAGGDGAAPSGAGPEALVLGDESSAVLVGALGRLPEHLRVVVVLRYYAGLTEAEIATAVKRRPGTVKSRLHEARRRLAADPAVDALGSDREEVR
jgi:RNA polymerase sigma-70 factor (ECF subfamily)